MKFILSSLLVFLCVFVKAQVPPPMVLGGPQGIDVTRLLARNWMSTPIYTDTPSSPLTGAGWPGRGYLITVVRNETACQNCPPKDTTLWMYTGARWKRVGYDYLTRLVYGGTVSKASGQNLQYIIQPYGAFFDGDYKISSSNRRAILSPKTIDNTSRIDVLVLNRDSFQVKTGTPRTIPQKPLVTGSEVEVASFYFKAFDSIPTVINTSAKVTNIFRVPGIDSFYFNIDTLTFAIKDSVGITKNDTAFMLNNYKFTAANGLTKDSTVFRLGGSLNQNTNINLNTRRLTIIGGSDTTRFFAGGQVSIGGRPDSNTVHHFIVNRNSKLGNLEINSGRGASMTGVGIRVDGADQPFKFQGSVKSGSTPIFQFVSHTNDTAPTGVGQPHLSRDIIRVSQGFLRGASTPAIDTGRYNVLNIEPKYNIWYDSGRTLIRGIYYNPTIQALNKTTHIAYQNTTGSNLMNSVSGNTRIGYNTYDTTFKLDVNGDARVTRLLVNTTTVDTSSAVNIVSTTKGFLQPRMTNTQRDAISTPAQGLQVFSTTDSANYVYRGTGGGWQKIANEISGSFTMNFPATNNGTHSDIAVTLTGATSGDVVSIGVPDVSVLNHSCYTAWVSADNEVTVRFNNYGSGNLDPASGTFKIKVFK